MEKSKKRPCWTTAFTGFVPVCVSLCVCVCKQSSTWAHLCQHTHLGVRFIFRWPCLHGKNFSFILVFSFILQSFCRSFFKPLCLFVQIVQSC